MAELLQALDFSGRRVLITGGARGIGKGAVKAFVELKATVFILDKDEEAIAQMKLEFPTVTAVKVDLRNWDETREAVKPLLPIHHLVNNAGVINPGSVLTIDEKHVDEHLAINFKQLLNVSQVVANGMIAHAVKGGTIVNLTTVDDIAVPPAGDFCVPMYCCTKASVAMLTKVLGVELAAHGIRSNTVRPSAVRTEMVAKLASPAIQKALDILFERMVLTRTFLTVTDVVKGIIYLSSELSAGITGTSLTIDAGFSMF